MPVCWMSTSLSEGRRFDNNAEKSLYNRIAQKHYRHFVAPYRNDISNKKRHLRFNLKCPHHFLG